MMARKRMFAMMTLAFLFAGVACGSDAEPLVDSGIDDDTELRDLTDEQVEEINDAYADAITSPALIEPLCALRSALASEVSDAEPCEDAAEECIEERREVTLSDDMTLENPLQGDLSGCTATVADLEACFNEGLDATVAAVSDVTCDSSTQDIVAVTLELRALARNRSAACDDVAAQCSGESE